MKRLSYVDWMRGLACLIMFQAHCYDAWILPELRETHLYKWSQLFATLPAPLFLFVAGISVSLTSQRLRERGIVPSAVARHTILRGTEVFGYGVLFRIQEYALGYRWVPWTDLLRVDILNMLGLSIVALGVLQWLTRSSDVQTSRRRTFVVSLVCAAVVALATPPLWTTWRPRFLPWPIESYLNGVHTFNEPQHWLFPFFPWSAFAFAGLGTGTAIFTDWAQRNEEKLFAAITSTGIAACLLSMAFDESPIRLYAVYDYWHSSPNFFLLRCGVLLVMLALAFAWCRSPIGRYGFSPTVQLGKTSLLVYWVHIELVYGTLSILPKRQCTINRASLGLGVIFLAMLALSLWRTDAKQKSVRVLQAVSRESAPAA